MNNSGRLSMIKRAIICSIAALAAATQGAIAQQITSPAVQEAIGDWNTADGVHTHLTKSFKALVEENQSLQAKLKSSEDKLKAAEDELAKLKKPQK